MKYSCLTSKSVICISAKLNLPEIFKGGKKKTLNTESLCDCSTLKNPSALPERIFGHGDFHPYGCWNIGLIKLNVPWVSQTKDNMKAEFLHSLIMETTVLQSI